jgi:hypothetical protein
MIVLRVNHDKETIMAQDTQGKDKQGRSYDQVTRGGSTSAGSMGAGATGDVGAMPGSEQSATAGGSHSGGRTDDLLAGSAQAEQDGKGFAGGEHPSELQTGMSGIGNAGKGAAGASRQSGELNQQGIGGQRTTEVDRDEGNSAREDQQNR